MMWWHRRKEREEDLEKRVDEVERLVNGVIREVESMRTNRWNDQPGKVNEDERLRVVGEAS